MKKNNTRWSTIKFDTKLKEPQNQMDISSHHTLDSDLPNQTHILGTSKPLETKKTSVVPKSSKTLSSKRKSAQSGKSKSKNGTNLLLSSFIKKGKQNTSNMINQQGNDIKKTGDEVKSTPPPKRKRIESPPSSPEQIAPAPAPAPPPPPTVTEESDSSDHGDLETDESDDSSTNESLITQRKEDGDDEKFENEQIHKEQPPKTKSPQKGTLISMGITANKVPVVVKTIKQHVTKTYQNEKGYTVSEDVIEDVFVEETLPIKTVPPSSLDVSTKPTKKQESDKIMIVGQKNIKTFFQPKNS